LSSDILGRVRHSTLFGAVDDDKFDEIKHRLTRRDFKAQDVIVNERDRDDRVFVVAEGRVRIIKRDLSGNEAVFALLHDGDFFGGGELIDGRPRQSRVVAVDKCVLLELTKNDFDWLLEKSHPFALRLLQVVSMRLHTLDRHFFKELERSLGRNKQEIEKMRNLVEATKVLNSTFELDRLLDIILDIALKIIHADRGTIYLIDPEKHELWSKVLKGLERAEIRLPVGKGLAGHVAATGEVVNIPDAYLDSRFNPDVDKKTGYRTKSILCVPMRDKDGKIVGVVQLFNKLHGLFNEDDAGFIEALSVHASIAIENARLYDQERQKIAMEKDLQAARDVQMTLLPKSNPVVEGYDIAGMTIPALTVGGDYYDFIPMEEGRIGICLGDVSGKGLPASLLMANLQAALRSLAFLSQSTKEYINKLNKFLCEITPPDKFITLFLGVLNFRDNILGFSNAGHNPPFHYTAAGPPKPLQTGGIILSVMKEFEFEDDNVSLSSGDVVIIYSDGITEAVNTANEQYGEERLIEIGARLRNLPANEIVKAIADSVNTFAGEAPQADDMTLVVIKKL
jgi:sigma-B regulation protein RsbU (phosphoserine phosphatase)